MNNISKQDIIEAIQEVNWYHINNNGELVSGANSKEHEPLYKANDIYKAIDHLFEKKLLN